MRQPTLLLIASVGGFLAVALGAFGAHGLKGVLTPDMLTVFHTGVEYQFYYSLALLALAMAPSTLSSKWTARAGVAFTFGIIVFCGSLYVLSLTSIKALGAITPIGGVGFLCGWGFLIYAAFNAYRR